MTQYRRTALIGLLLTLPGALMYTLLVLGIEPPLGFLKPLLDTPIDGPNIVGSLIALTIMVLLPLAAFVINLRLIRRTGGGIFEHPANVIVIAVALALGAAVVGSIIADQYPCWTGVPNCD